MVVLVRRLYANTEDSRLNVVHATLLLTSLHLAAHVYPLPQLAVTTLYALLHLATDAVIE